jgi:hypothetical protein
MKPATAMVEGWDRLWGSFHEAAHAVVARRLGLQVQKVTMRYTRIPHRLYKGLSDPNNLNRLIVAAAGDACTLLLLGWEQNKNQGGDDDMSFDRLHDMGASKSQANEMMTAAGDVATSYVDELREAIFSVADALCLNGELNEAQLDEAICQAGLQNWEKHAVEVQMFREYFEKHPMS